MFQKKKKRICPCDIFRFSVSILNLSSKKGSHSVPKSEDYVSDPLLSDQAFCLVYVVDANTIQFASDRLTDKLRIIRKRISDKRETGL